MLFRILFISLCMFQMIFAMEEQPESIKEESIQQEAQCHCHLGWKRWLHLLGGTSCLALNGVLYFTYKNQMHDSMNHICTRCKDSPIYVIQENRTVWSQHIEGSNCSLFNKTQMEHLMTEWKTPGNYFFHNGDQYLNVTVNQLHNVFNSFDFFQCESPLRGAENLLKTMDQYTGAVSLINTLWAVGVLGGSLIKTCPISPCRCKEKKVFNEDDGL